MTKNNILVHCKLDISIKLTLLHGVKLSYIFTDHQAILQMKSHPDVEILNMRNMHYN